MRSSNSAATIAALGDEVEDAALAFGIAGIPILHRRVFDLGVVVRDQLLMLGTAIYLGTYRGLLASALTFAGWWLKSRMEEEFMLRQFGPLYREYQRHVKALIPFVL